MVAREHTNTAYDFYVETLAHRQNRQQDEILAEMSYSGFLETVHDLHHRYINGEFSFGKLADLLDINPFQLDYLLSTLGMAVHN